MLRKAQQGFLLISAVIIIVVVGLLAATVSYVVITNSRSMANQLDAMRAYYIAESGLERAIYARQLEYVACNAVKGHPLLTNIPFGAGVFTATATSFVPSTRATLTSNISNSATTIPVSTLTGFASMGRVIIDNESIDYSSTSQSAAVCGVAPCLTNVRRARADTTAAAHTVGATLMQNICQVTVTGDVPNATTPIAERQVSESMTFGFGGAWIVGDTSNVETIFGWNGSIWNQMPDANGYPGVSNVRLNDVVINSLTDGWAVGNREDGHGLIIHWDGANWADFPALGVPNENLNAVTCVNGSDCWAVGDSATFVHYTNGSWSPVSVNGVLAPINDISCVNSNDCWAVGNKEDGRSLLMRWNGANWSRDIISILPNRDLEAVACVNSNNFTKCFAVGQGKTFLYYNGIIWLQQITSADIPNTTYNGVSCSSFDDCWAVGGQQGRSTLVHWNGTSWVNDESIVDSNLKQALYDISCLKTDACWAVGNVRTFARWNGVRWTKVDPALGAPSVNLYGVSFTINAFGKLRMLTD